MSKRQLLSLASRERNARANQQTASSRTPSYLREIRAPSQCMISRPPLLPAALPIEPFVQPCLLPNRSLRERARQAGRPFCMWGFGFFRLRRVVRGGDGGGVMRFQSRSFSCRARRARSQPSSSLSSISLFAVSICVLLFPRGTLGVCFACANECLSNYVDQRLIPL